MKALFVNGSPRKNWTTFKMLESAMKGAIDAGADAEMIHLYDFAFKGCVSCLACKLKNAKTNGLCAFKDSLTPILEKAFAADVLVVGSPVYFDYPTGPVRSFLERLMFPVLTYNYKTDPETEEIKASILTETKHTAIIYTMGRDKESMEECRYPEILGVNGKFLKLLFGHSETLCSYNAYQFGDYSQYDVIEGLEEIRRKHREEEFPKELQSAYELGRRLTQLAEKRN
ncbi:MAG: flavodoxin family protein [Thermoguttaceae bacterium]|nr:flavodoxin family protein [Thermoguttaceae bacterium]